MSSTGNLRVGDQASMMKVYTWEDVAQAAGYASPKTAREYARRAIDPLRVWETCGRIWAWKERCRLWRGRQEEGCSQPRIEGTAACLAFLGLKDDEALLKLVRLPVDPFPARYDGRRLVVWESAAEDWIEANTRPAVTLRAPDGAPIDSAPGEAAPPADSDRHPPPGGEGTRPEDSARPAGKLSPRVALARAADGSARQPGRAMVNVERP